MAPTYRERDSITAFLRSVRAAAPDVDILVVDDASDDGTADLARAAAGSLGRIDVVERHGERGLGGAYRHGIALALDRGYAVVVTMDVDGSHDPGTIGALVDAVGGGVDVAIGSRYVAGGAVIDWPLRRRLLSRLGNRYASAVLGLPIGDCTSAFRAYRAEVLKAVSFGDTSAEGYAFLVEVARRVVRRGHAVVEVPIVFVDREAGSSKMSWRIIFESTVLVTGWGLRDLPGRLGRLRRLTRGRRRAT